MAEALGVTASVIAVATLAWESSKKLYELVDKLSDVPEAISHTKTTLSTTQNAIDTLKIDLATGDSALFDALLQRFRMAEALEGSRKECDMFGRKLETYIKHSTFSKRDRFIVNFHESEINQFNGHLQDHRQVIVLVTTSLNRMMSSSTDAQQLSERFARQETELSALNTHLNQTLSDLQSLSISTRANESAATAVAEDREWSVNSIPTLQSICQDALSATSDANPIKQQFGDVSADNSRYHEGIAGKAQGNIIQVHGKAVVTGGSTTARGQMDADTFKVMFGSH